MKRRSSLRLPASIEQRLCVGFWWVALLILAAALLVRPLTLLLTDPADVQRVVDYLVDDAYYYLGIAANVAEQGRSTLDGITRTNGYHPLWLLALAGLASIVGTDPWPLFVAASALISLIPVAGVALALRWRQTPAAGIAVIAASSLAITVLYYPTVFLTGMEPIAALLAFVPMGASGLLFTVFLINRVSSGLSEAAASGADVALITRGGYGLTRLLPDIDYKAVAKAIAKGTQFVGLSDFTAFQNALLARTGAVSVTRMS